jgi:hypothetical protein
MTTTDPVPPGDRDLLLEIEVTPGDAALLRVVSTLHHRHASVRSLRFEGLGHSSQLRVRVADGATRGGTLIGALRRCVDVLNVRPVPAFEWARG